MERRTFLGLTASALAGAGIGFSSTQEILPKPAWAADLWDPYRAYAGRSKPLRVQPVLMYRVPQEREAASWKSWGGVQTHEAASAEAERIDSELNSLARGAPFPVRLLPLVKVTSPEEALRLRAGAHDAAIVFPAAGSGDLLRACLSLSPKTVIFVRHRSGPIYYWYEALSVRYLCTSGPSGRMDLSAAQSDVTVDDVVVDDPLELLWRLRALHGALNFTGSRIVALGGPGGKYAPDAPEKARERYRLEIIEESYDRLAGRIQNAAGKREYLSRAEAWTEAYLSLPKTELAADKKFVVNAFLLYGLFRDILNEHEATIFTINRCMGTILPMARTTACLALSLLNDEGLVAFCESDFVIIPAGILLHYVSGKPVFLHNSTFPHRSVVTCAHCTAPRRMDGTRHEPARILTHYESDYGAAPKVQMPIGQLLTFVDPEYATGRWIGLKGIVEDNPNYDICRSQQDVRILGDWKRLLNEVRDSHWVAVYGDCLREVGYAARKVGVNWEEIPQ